MAIAPAPILRSRERGTDCRWLGREGKQQEDQVLYVGGTHQHPEMHWKPFGDRKYPTIHHCNQSVGLKVTQFGTSYLRSISPMSFHGYTLSWCVPRFPHILDRLRTPHSTDLALGLLVCFFSFSRIRFYSPRLGRNSWRQLLILTHSATPPKLSFLL